MSKSCCSAFVLAVICLTLKADAHLTVTVDDPTSRSSAALEVRIVPVKGKEEIEGCGETNGTRPEDVAKEIKDEIGDVKKTIISECGGANETTLEKVAEKIKEEMKREFGLLSDKITDVKRLLASGSVETNEINMEPSKQALVSALVCEYLVSVQFDNVGSTQRTQLV